MINLTQKDYFYLPDWQRWEYLIAYCIIALVRVRDITHFYELLIGMLTRERFGNSYKK